MLARPEYSRSGDALGASEAIVEDTERRERKFRGIMFEDDPRAVRDHGSPGRPIIGMRNGVEFGRAG